MVTEQEYLQALKVINEYTDQIKRKTEQALLKTGVTKTPNEIDLMDFPLMSGRLWRILVFNFGDVRICDIKKKDFLKVPNAGRVSWVELCELTGKNPYT